MNWVQSLTKAINYIENNLTQEITVSDVANHVYISVAHYQRMFSLVTGITIGEYIRNRRLSLAGQDLLNPESKIIDIAMKYQYDSQESFSKAFTRFHEITPSVARKQSHKLKCFRPMTISIIIQGGFDMSRKLIDHLPIHQLQYPEQGQNYVFNGCMKFLMECIGEDEQYDYWFFSAVSGDAFVQIFGTNKDKWNICFSQSKFDYELIERVFDSIGYDFSFLSDEDWRKDKQKCKEKIMEYIDRGVPVIGQGFGYPGVSCIVGYENDGECFYYLQEENTELESLTLEDELPYTFVFIEAKKEAPPISEVYRKALLNAPQLMQTPCLQGDVFFGNEAFEQWANILESGFYNMSREKFEADNAIAAWRYYCVYICIIATNIFHKKDTTDRAVQMNPDLAKIAPPLEKEYTELCELENRLKEVEGYFNVNYEVLQDSVKCTEIAGIIRSFSDIYIRICDILKSV